jgi:hypothetical protein
MLKNPARDDLTVHIDIEACAVSRRITAAQAYAALEQTKRLISAARLCLAISNQERAARNALSWLDHMLEKNNLDEQGSEALKVAHAACMSILSPRRKSGEELKRAVQMLHKTLSSNFDSEARGRGLGLVESRHSECEGQYDD